VELLEKLSEIRRRLTEPTDEELLENLFCMLKGIIPKAELWFALDRLVSERYKVEIEVKRLDWGKFSYWFNTNLYRPIVSSGGNFEFKGGTYWSCSEEDLRKILERDFTNHKRYQEQFVCTEFTVMLRARLAHVYGIDACGSIWTVVPERGAGHSFCFLWTTDNKPLGIEPQTDSVWDYSEITPSDPFYKLENVRYFRM